MGISCIGGIGEFVECIIGVWFFHKLTDDLLLILKWRGSVSRRSGSDKPSELPLFFTGAPALWFLSVHRPSLILALNGACK